MSLELILQLKTWISLQYYQNLNLILIDLSVTSNQVYDYMVFVRIALQFHNKTHQIRRDWNHVNEMKQFPKFWARYTVFLFLWVCFMACWTECKALYTSTTAVWLILLILNTLNVHRDIKRQRLDPNLTIKRKEALVLREEDTGWRSPGNAANVKQTDALGGFV